MIKTFAINTLGCKVNQYETQQIREFLESFGLVRASDSACADLIIINTCCVTHTASAKSRRCLRKAVKLNPSARIVVAGCLPAVDTGELDLSEIRPDIVTEKDKLITYLHNIVKSRETPVDHHPEGFLPLRKFQGQTRAFLKVQDGCDGFCSYCIIPRTRPKVRSRDPDQIIKEATSLVGSGHSELVVTGVFLGAYGKPTVRRRKWGSPENHELVNLLGLLADIEGLQRIRLSSLEPADVTEELLRLMAENDNFAPHLHLSLQSGSDEILRRMNRQYTSGQFCEKVQLAKRILDKPAITADIIVGFPGETEQDFQRSRELMNWAGFAKTHIFTFSERAHTAAAKMPDKLNPRLIKDRAKILHQLDERLQASFREKFIGKEVSVLIEKGGSAPRGRCGRYFTVELPQAKARKNTFVRAALIKNGLQTAIGRLVSTV